MQHVARSCCGKSWATLNLRTEQLWQPCCTNKLLSLKGMHALLLPRSAFVSLNTDLSDHIRRANFALVVLCTPADQSHRGSDRCQKLGCTRGWLTAEDIRWQHHKSARLSHEIISLWPDANVTRLKTHHLSDWWKAVVVSSEAPQQSHKCHILM